MRSILMSISPSDLNFLKKSIEFETYYDDEFGYYHGYNEKLELHAFGDTLTELKKNVIDEMCFLHDFLNTPKNERDKKLDEVLNYFSSLIEIS